MESMQERLKEFASSDLQNELDRRSTQAKEDAKDRAPRTFYRKVEKQFPNLKAKVAFINSLSAEQQETMIERKSYSGREETLYLLDVETEEEVRLRLSRTAFADENHDQCTAYFYEDGKEIGSVNTIMLSEAESYAEAWEDDQEYLKDNFGEDDNNRMQEHLGFSGFHPSTCDCWGSTKYYRERNK